MAEQLQLRRGSTAANNALTGAAGELTADTTLNQLRLHDGSTAGGHTIGAGGAVALDDLSDVTVTSPATGAVLTYNGSAWVDGTVALADTDAVSGELAVANGGTGGGNAATARSNLGFGTFLLHSVFPWHSRGDANMTLTDVAAGDAFLGKSNANVAQFDATHYTHVRVTARIGTAATAGTKIVAKYRLVSSGYSSTIGDYVAIGTSAVELPLSSTGVIASSWITLASGAKADILLCPVQTGGDGATDPAIRHLAFEFKRE